VLIKSASLTTNVCEKEKVENKNNKSTCFI
jgi:hypothetical protein